jgi:hypothetical protein
MLVFTIKEGDKLITVKKATIKNLNNKYIGGANGAGELNPDAVVFIRCNKRGVPKLYDDKYLIYPTTTPIIDVLHLKPDFITRVYNWFR